MSKTMLRLYSVAAIAAGAVWTSPAGAAERHADGLRNAPQIEVSAQRRYRRYGRAPHYYRYGYYPYRYGYYPYDAYAYGPYRYRYYAPGPYVRFGPFAFGVW